MAAPGFDVLSQLVDLCRGLWTCPNTCCYVPSWKKSQPSKFLTFKAAVEAHVFGMMLLDFFLPFFLSLIFTFCFMQIAIILLRYVRWLLGCCWSLLLRLLGVVAGLAWGPTIEEVRGARSADICFLAGRSLGIIVVVFRVLAPVAPPICPSARPPTISAVAAAPSLILPIPGAVAAPSLILPIP